MLHVCYLQSSEWEVAGYSFYISPTHVNIAKVTAKTFFFYFYLKGNSGIFNLDLISGMKYVHLLTERSLVKVSVLWKIFRFLEIHITE